MVRDLLTRYPSGSGYTVLEAEDAQHALNVSQGYSGPIRVLVTDLMLTSMDGLSLAEKMRGRSADLRCVLISGHPASVPEQDPRYGPGIVFLSKPFQLRDVLQVIQECVRGSWPGCRRGEKGSTCFARFQHYNTVDEWSPREPALNGFRSGFEPRSDD